MTRQEGGEECEECRCLCGTPFSRLARPGRLKSIKAARCLLETQTKHRSPSKSREKRGRESGTFPQSRADRRKNLPSRRPARFKTKKGPHLTKEIRPAPKPASDFCRSPCAEKLRGKRRMAARTLVWVFLAALLSWVSGLFFFFLETGSLSVCLSLSVLFPYSSGPPAGALFDPPSRPPSSVSPRKRPAKSAAPSASAPPRPPSAFPG